MALIDVKQAVTLTIGIGLGAGLGVAIIALLAKFGIKQPAGQINSRIRHVTGGRHA